MKIILPQTWSALVLLLLPLPILGFQATTAPSDRPRVDGVKRSYADHATIPEQRAQPKDAEEEVTEMTLYEVLGASPMATRDELKRCYVKMAKQSHPDAQLGRNQQTDSEAPTYDFSEIAAAWKVLGDNKMRRRYDRTLQADKWYKKTQQMTNEGLERAVPVMSEMLDKVAFPFLRRTTATTVAVGQAVAEGISRASAKETKETARTEKLADTLLSVVEAGQNAGRAIDSMELTEKSMELEERAQKEKLRANKIAEELARVTAKRLFGTLLSPDFALSSEEALQVLEMLGEIEGVTVDRAMFKTPVGREIDGLKKAEKEFSEKLSVYEETDNQWNGILKEQETAKHELSLAKQTEIDARRALIKAEARVAQAKGELVSKSNALKSVEQQVRKNSSDMDKITVQLYKKQDRVRTAIQKKAADRINQETHITLTEGDIATLRQKEIQLMGESTQLKGMVHRLQSKAETLRNRASTLDRWQKGQQPAPGAGSQLSD